LDIIDKHRLLITFLRSSYIASGVTSKPATRGRLKTGHGEWPKTSVVLPCRGGFGQGRI
jgi:hypothetical protein